MLITEDLIALIEGSEARRLRGSALASGGDVIDIAGGVAAFCGDGSPLTQVCGVGVRHEVTDSNLQAIADHFAGRAKQYEFKLSPLCDQDLRIKIVTRAKSLPEFESMLVRDLQEYRPEEVGFDIRPVDPADVHAYAARSVYRFFSGEPGPPGLVEVIAQSCLREGSLSFEVFIDDKPVAGCGLGLCEGIAWLQGAATLPEFRNRGLHKAMQRFRMNVAKSQGYEVMAQGALPGSASQINAQKVGFQIAYTRPTFYL